MYCTFCKSIQSSFATFTISQSPHLRARREKHAPKKILLLRLIVRMENQHFSQNGLKPRHRYRSSAGPASRCYQIPLNCILSLNSAVRRGLSASTNSPRKIIFGPGPLTFVFSIFGSKPARRKIAYILPMILLALALPKFRL